METLGNLESNHGRHAPGAAYLVLIDTMARTLSAAETPLADVNRTLSGSSPRSHIRGILTRTGSIPVMTSRPGALGGSICRFDPDQTGR